MPTTPIATDSAAEMREIFVDSDPTGTASSENVEVQRDTDDVEDSEEEETEADDEFDDDDELEDEDDEEEDDELADEEDDEDELVAVDVLGASGLTSVRSHAALFVAAEDDDDAGDVDPGVDEDEIDSDDLDTDRVADAALRMNALVAVTAELAESVRLEQR